MKMFQHGNSRATSAEDNTPVNELGQPSMDGAVHSLVSRNIAAGYRNPGQVRTVVHHDLAVSSWLLVAQLNNIISNILPYKSQAVSAKGAYCVTVTFRPVSDVSSRAAIGSYGFSDG